MPTYEITSPDGRKFRISGEGTKEEALAHFQQQYQAEQAPPSQQAQLPQQPPAQSPVDNRPVGDLLSAIIEPVSTLASGAAASAIGGYANILGTAWPGDPLRGRRWQEAIQEAMTYQPSTKAGQFVNDAISYIPEKIAEGGNWAGEKTAEITGSPATGAFVNTAIQAAPALLTRRATVNRGNPVSRPAGPAAAPREVAPAAKPAAPAQRAPGLEGVRQQADVEVAPNLVLETQRRPVTPKEKVAEARAKQYAQSIGLDWASLNQGLRESLTSVASDAKNLAKLDPEAVRRQVQLQSMPVPVPATRGVVTRDPVQLRNEGNVSATEAGRPIRETHLDANDALLQNIEVLKGRVANKTGGAQTPEQVGLSVQDAALREKQKLKKAEVKKKYDDAEAAGELQGKVSPARLIQTVRNSPDVSHFGWVESWLTKNEVIKKTDSGTITQKLTLKQLEDLRQAAVARAMDGGTEGFYAGKVIRAIDDTTDGAGGKLYKEARKARREQALEFEETGAIARLVENKSRTDRSTALEDTWRKTVVSGSIQDLRNVKRSLLTGGDAATRTAGRRAWRDIKAQTIQHIQDEATKGVALNERGAPNITPAAMKRAIDSIGRDKLNEIFGEGTAMRLDRILEATRTVKTVPPALHQGSSTMGNVLAFLERGLNRIPVVGDVGAGAIKAGVKLKEMGEAGRVVRSSQDLPLKPQPKPQPPLQY